MPFTTTTFLFFILPLTILGYYIINLLKNNTLNNLFIILVSIIFYANAGLKNIVYFIIFILIIFFAGKSIEYSHKNRRKVFILFLTFVLIVLTYYKYALFVYNVLLQINVNLILFSDVIVPLGMSFVMFEAISYLIDIYRKDAKSGSIIDVILFFTFFPKISAGPIVLWKDFSSQIENRVYSVDNFFVGIERIIIGLAKKAIIADTLGSTVQNITVANVNGIDSTTAILGMLCYFLQIYFDFSGYSDIALGLSRMFGFNFKENFNYPYTSTTLSEFWRRWHISLGTWFREYIYIPLGGNRRNVYLNLFIVFLLTGIWHGSTINFVLWGVLHGIFILCERAVKDKNWYINTPALIKWIVVMLFVALTWIIFMLPSLEDAMLWYNAIFGNTRENIYFSYEYFFTPKLILIMIIGFIGAFVGKVKFINTNLTNWVNTTIVGTSFKMVVYIILFILAILFMVNSSYSPFLYFQF